MPTIEVTHAELGHLYDAADRGLCSLDDQLGDYREELLYTQDDWSRMKANRDRWARVLTILARAIEENANAND